MLLTLVCLTRMLVVGRPSVLMRVSGVRPGVLPRFGIRGAAVLAHPAVAEIEKVVRLVHAKESSDLQMLDVRSLDTRLFPTALLTPSSAPVVSRALESDRHAHSSAIAHHIHGHGFTNLMFVQNAI